MVKDSGSDENDDVAKVVRRVKAEVREIPLPREYDFTFSKIVADISETLLRLVSSLVSDGNVTKPSLTISQTIQQHISGARNQATIGSDIKLHHKHGSSDAIKLLNSHGLVSSYYEGLWFLQISCLICFEEHWYNYTIRSWSSQWSLDQYLAGGTTSM